MKRMVRTAGKPQVTIKNGGVKKRPTPKKKAGVVIDEFETLNQFAKPKGRTTRNLFSLSSNFFVLLLLLSYPVFSLTTFLSFCFLPWFLINQFGVSL